MSGRAGIELSPATVRFARVSITGRVVESFELPWNPARPDEVVRVLRTRTGKPSAICLTIGLGFLEVARTDLPPLAARERARIIELEPDRYFAAAAHEPHVATVSPDESIAFATPSAQLDAWISAFDSWATVEWVEPAPLSVARAMERDGKGLFAVETVPGETGLLQLDRGRVTSVRRARERIADARPLPSIGTTTATFVASLGAARWAASGSSSPALAPEPRRRTLAARQRSSMVVSAIAAVAALTFGVWSADRWRERTLAALEVRVTSAQSGSAAADSALALVRSRENEASVLREVGSTRADPLAALAALSAALPNNATVLSARANGNDWQIDGTTSDASALVPLLDRQQHFDSVRFLSASSRYRDADRSYETFSIAFRFRP